MTDAELRQIIRDAHGYAQDARASSRLRMTDTNLTTTRIRLEAAQRRIERAVAEIDAKLTEESDR